MESDKKKTAKREGKLKRPLEARPGRETLIDGTYADFVRAVLRGDRETFVAIGKDLPDHDELPEDVAGIDVHSESSDQRAIPLEYRWIRSRYKADEIDSAIKRIVDDVRRANLRELSDDQRKVVLGATKKPS